MNISQLEYFVATVREGSYSTAARSLYLTHQAVQKAISDLERELDVQLVEKIGRNIQPTKFGLEFAQRAEGVLLGFSGLELLAKLHAGKITSDGVVSVMTTSIPYRGATHSAQSFSKLASEYPNIKLELHFNVSSVCLSAVEEEITDAAIILGTVNRPGIRCVQLFSLVPEIAMCKKSDFASLDRIPLSSIGKIPIASPCDLRYCYREIERQIEHSCGSAQFEDVAPSYSAHMKFLEEKNGLIFVLPDQRLHDLFPEVVFKKIESKDQFAIPVCLVFRDCITKPELSCLARCLSTDSFPQSQISSSKRF